MNNEHFQLVTVNNEQLDEHYLQYGSNPMTSLSTMSNSTPAMAGKQPQVTPSSSNITASSPPTSSTDCSDANNTVLKKRVERKFLPGKEAGITPDYIKQHSTMGVKTLWPDLASDLERGEFDEIIRRMKSMYAGVKDLCTIAYNEDLKQLASRYNLVDASTGKVLVNSKDIVTAALSTEDEPLFQTFLERAIAVCKLTSGVTGNSVAEKAGRSVCKKYGITLVQMKRERTSFISDIMKGMKNDTLNSRFRRNMGKKFGCVWHEKLEKTYEHGNKGDKKSGKKKERSIPDSWKPHTVLGRQGYLVRKITTEEESSIVARQAGLLAKMAGDASSKEQYMAMCEEAWNGSNNAKNAASESFDDRVSTAIICLFPSVCVRVSNFSTTFCSEVQ